MDLSKHATLAKWFATLALVFSVSACVLSHSMTDDHPVNTKPMEVEGKQPEASQQKAIAEEPAGKSVQPAKTTAAAKSTQPKPGTLREANQKITKLASDGKLDQIRTRKIAEQRRVNASRKVVRYVSVETLNVRMHSSLEAPVVGKLTRGTMYHVNIDGNWAKIGDNQYVMTKFLSPQPPKRSTSTWTYRK
jgi:hypothetical protein